MSTSTGPAPNLLPASQVHNLFGTMDIRGSMRTDPECLYTIMTFGGIEGVLEAVACGRLINEIALQVQIPIRWLDAWVEQNVPGEEMSRSYRLGAESLMAKANMVLSIDVKSAHEGAQARALADRFVKLAEQTDSQRWGTKRSDGLAGQTVNISMNIGSGKSVQAQATVEDAEVVNATPITTSLVPRKVDPINIHCPEPAGGYL